MRIAVIGAGFTGLAAAVSLVESGHEVAVFEKDSQPGGLAVGFKGDFWDWQLEKHYHHLFTSDRAIRDLAARVGHSVTFYRPTTSTWVDQGTFPLDTPLNLLLFPGMPFFDRLRTGMVLAFLKFNPFWRPLEKITAKNFIMTTMGHTSWQVLWQPLMEHKFGLYCDRIAASWFWARVVKRSSSLGYPDGGFQKLADSLQNFISEKGGQFYFGTGIRAISTDMTLTTDSGKKHHFEKVICTLPSPAFIKIAPKLPKSYLAQLNSLIGIGAVNLILSLKKPFLPHHIYWLNVNRPKTPFLALIEHTNFISPGHYAGQHLLYIGNYLPASHPYFQKTAPQLLTEFMPGLKEINPGFSSSWVIDSWVWKAPFAQPVIPVNYSQNLPSVVTPVKNLYLANIQQVYPWDRGTNYAVELGNLVAQICLTS